MQIKINDNELKVNNSISLHEVLTDQNYINKSGIAVAVNNSVVPKSDWNNCTLSENDSILIISATKGG